MRFIPVPIDNNFNSVGGGACKILCYRVTGQLTALPAQTSAISRSTLLDQAPTKHRRKKDHPPAVKLAVVIAFDRLLAAVLKALTSAWVSVPG
jgi:hypothetical protein